MLKEDEEGKRRRKGTSEEEKTKFSSTQLQVYTKYTSLQDLLGAFSDVNHGFGLYITFKINYVVTVQCMSPQIANSKISLPVENSAMQMINCENLCATS